jgi:hypothetical protein
MATAPVGTSALDAYREEADRFMAALDEEFYLHFAGHKDAFDVGAVYDRFAGLTTLETCAMLRRAAGERADHGTRELWRFACEGYLGALTREQTEEIGRLEATARRSASGCCAPRWRTSPTAPAASGSSGRGTSSWRRS